MKKALVDFVSQFSLVQRYFSGVATILMLHRVAQFEHNKLFPNESMKVSPEFLDKFISRLRDSGHSFISLDELFEILKKGSKAKKCIVFTLDDGYKDNYTTAYPVFRDHNVPFAIYVTTSFPEYSAILWWYALEEIILKNKEVIFNNTKYACEDFQQKNELFLKIRNVILSYVAQSSAKNEIENFFHAYAVDWASLAKKLAMTWDNIIELSRDPLCTIAGHTENHYSLNRLSESGVRDEIVGANKLIESKINRKVEHFAYPFGSRDEIGKREFDIVKTLGIKTATTTRCGNIFLEHKNYLESLPRVMLAEGMDFSSMYRARRKRIVTL